MFYSKKPEECEHLNITNEYYLGTQTGDYICLDCGQTFSEKPNN